MADTITIRTDAETEHALEVLTLDLDPRIRILARTAKPATVRSLDAIHLGTALHFRSELTSFVTYDKRLLDAAEAAGIPVDSPA